MDPSIQFISPNIKKWDKRFLTLAKHVSGWSKDPSTKVGAVITDLDNRIVSMGYNGFPRLVEDSTERQENRDLKLKLIMHAEVNALLFARGPVSTCWMYTTLLPCAQCAGKIIQSGISRVVTIEAPKALQERWSADFELTRVVLKEAGVQVSEYDAVDLAIG